MDVAEMLDIIKSAKVDKAVHCIEGDTHDYQFVLNFNNRDTSAYYYRCKHCQDVITNQFAKHLPKPMLHS